MPVHPKIALVTGAGSGIGRAAAVELSRRGYALVLAGRRRERVEETAGLCTGETLAVTADVGEADDVARLFADAEHRFGRLDVLFNNAGTNISGPLDELAAKDLLTVVATNLLGSLYCARAAFALMTRQRPAGGRIINNGSVSAYAPRPDSTAYTASKHGITGLTKSLILDGRARGIACCQIDIGNAATEPTERMARGVPQADGRIAIEPRLDVALVARQVADLADLPPEANVPFITLMATGMPLYGRG
jgi:NAD(P)-dependent dehydrogenase (short-subunit alcohol dehydrogenase family)